MILSIKESLRACRAQMKEAIGDEEELTPEFLEWAVQDSLTYARAICEILSLCDKLCEVKP